MRQEGAGAKRFLLETLSKHGSVSRISPYPQPPCPSATPPPPSVLGRRISPPAPAPPPASTASASSAPAGNPSTSRWSAASISAACSSHSSPASTDPKPPTSRRDSAATISARVAGWFGDRTEREIGNASCSHNARVGWIARRAASGAVKARKRIRCCPQVCEKSASRSQLNRLAFNNVRNAPVIGHLLVTRRRNGQCTDRLRGVWRPQPIVDPQPQSCLDRRCILLDHQQVSGSKNLALYRL